MNFIMRAICVAIAIIGALGAVSTFSTAQSAGVAWGAVSAMAVIMLLMTDQLERRRVLVEQAAKALAAKREAIKSLASTLVGAAADIAAAANDATELAESL